MHTFYYALILRCEVNVNLCFFMNYWRFKIYLLWHTVTSRPAWIISGKKKKENVGLNQMHDFGISSQDFCERQSRRIKWQQNNFHSESTKCNGSKHLWFYFLLWGKQCIARNTYTVWWPQMLPIISSSVRPT